MGGERAVHVLVATPLGPGGNGGIDRLMDSVRGELDRSPRVGVVVDFGVTRGSRSILLSPLVLLKFLTRMAVARARGKLDVVHINIASKGSTYRKLIVATAARTLGVATVLHLHGGGYRVFWDSAPHWLRRAMIRMFTQARQVIVLGHVWQEFLMERAPNASIVILPNASARISRPLDSAEKGLVHIIFLGRLGASKGVPELVDALAALRGLPNWRATIAGDGEVEATRERVAHLGLSGQIRVPGWVDASGVTALLMDADVLVLPSHVENLPMSIIEAMAAGLAVVATPVGAIPDVISDGETGLLVEPGNTVELAEALRQLVLRDDLRAELGAAAQASHRRNLEIGIYVDRLAAIWRRSAA